MRPRHHRTRNFSSSQLVFERLENRLLLAGPSAAEPNSITLNNDLPHNAIYRSVPCAQSPEDISPMNCPNLIFTYAEIAGDVPLAEQTRSGHSVRVYSNRTQTVDAIATTWSNDPSPNPGIIVTFNFYQISPFPNRVPPNFPDTILISWAIGNKMDEEPFPLTSRVQENFSHEVIIPPMDQVGKFDLKLSVSLVVANNRPIPGSHPGASALTTAMSFKLYVLAGQPLQSGQDLPGVELKGNSKRVVETAAMMAQNASSIDKVLESLRRGVYELKWIYETRPWRGGFANSVDEQVYGLLYRGLKDALCEHYVGAWIHLARTHGINPEGTQIGGHNNAGYITVADLKSSDNRTGNARGYDGGAYGPADRWILRAHVMGEYNGKFYDVTFNRTWDNWRNSFDGFATSKIGSTGWAETNNPLIDIFIGAGLDWESIKIEARRAARIISQEYEIEVYRNKNTSGAESEFKPLSQPVDQIRKTLDSQPIQISAVRRSHHGGWDLGVSLTLSANENDRLLVPSLAFGDNTTALSDDFFSAQQIAIIVPANEESTNVSFYVPVDLLPWQDDMSPIMVLDVFTGSPEPDLIVYEMALPGDVAEQISHIRLNSQADVSVRSVPVPPGAIEQIVIDAGFSWSDDRELKAKIAMLSDSGHVVWHGVSEVSNFTVIAHVPAADVLNNGESIIAVRITLLDEFDRPISHTEYGITKIPFESLLAPAINLADIKVSHWVGPGNAIIAIGVNHPFEVADGQRAFAVFRDQAGRAHSFELQATEATEKIETIPASRIASSRPGSELRLEYLLIGDLSTGMKQYYPEFPGAIPSSVTENLVGGFFGPWVNPENRFNVNPAFDDEVSVLDALLILNFLRRRNGDFDFSRDFILKTDFGVFPDVNDDLLITPLDALLVLNFLARNARQADGMPAGEHTIKAPSTFKLPEPRNATSVLGRHEHGAPHLLANGGVSAHAKTNRLNDHATNPVDHVFSTWKRPRALESADYEVRGDLDFTIHHFSETTI